MDASNCALGSARAMRWRTEGSMSSRLSDDEPLARDWVEAWRGDTADSARMRRAYLRFLQPQTARRRVPTLQIASWVLLGVAIGMGSLYAATGPLLPLW